jgi:hypothetical protein
MQSKPEHYAELQSPAAFPPDKEPPISTGQDWTTENVQYNMVESRNL